MHAKSVETTSTSRVKRILNKRTPSTFDAQSYKSTSSLAPTIKSESVANTKTISSINMVEEEEDNDMNDVDISDY